MSALVIDNTEYKFPNDFTIKEWMVLIKFINNEELLISEALKIPADDMKKMPDGTKSLMSQLIKGVMFPTFVQLNKENLINLNEITLGKFIDIDVAFQDVNKNIDKIINLLYNTDDASKMKISKTYAALRYYANWKKALFINYKNLFDAPVEEDEDVEYTQSKPQNIAQVWMDIVMTLADGKFLNIDAVTEKPLIQAFNWLAWNKDNKRREAELLRQQL